MQNKKIAIIGAGKLGASIAEGLLNANYLAPQNLILTRRKLASLEKFSIKGVEISSDNSSAMKKADILILAIKPHQIKDLLKEFSSSLSSNQLIISVVTGVSIQEMRETLANDEIEIFRAMPNTAIAIQESMTCVATDKSTESTDEVLGLFDKLGKAVLIDENLMGAATILAASGIAFALRFVRAASQGGIEIGFSSELAKLITTQTVKGAVTLLESRGTHPESEIDMVTTPRGVTISGINEMEHQGFSSSLIKGLLTSFDKIDKIQK